MATQEKLDLCKLRKNEYVTPKKPVLIDTETACYLAISGQGAPGGEAFTSCIGALYGMAFTVKMTRKFAGLQDYAVGRLEGQYFFDEHQDPATLPLAEYRWRLLIRTPDFITNDDLKQAAAKLIEKGKGTEVKNVKLETINEGKCVQMLHVGPYDREPDTIAVMKSFADSKGLRLIGPHHEIYISDPRRVQPERLKTILRMPVGPA